MNLVIILLELFLASLVDSLKDINSTPVCATLNNAYMTFPNIWQVYNKFATTGQLWVPVGSGACSGNNIDCTTLSPVCAESKNKIFRTFPNQCLLEAEQTATGTEWNIVYKGICSANPEQYTTRTDSILPQIVNYNQDPAQTSAAIYPVYSSSYDTASKTATEHYKPVQIQQPLGNYNQGLDSKTTKHLKLKKPEWTENYNHQKFASKKALLPLKPVSLPPYNNAPVGHFGSYNFAQKEQHSPSYDTAPSIANGNYKAVQMQQPSGDYYQGSDSKPSVDYNEGSKFKPGKSIHLQSKNLKWSGNDHQKLPKSSALSHLLKLNLKPSNNNAPAAGFGHYSSAQQIQHSPSHYSAPSVASGHYKPAQIQQPSGDYYQGSDLKPDKSVHSLSQNPKWYENYHQTLPKTPALSHPVKPDSPLSYKSAGEAASGNYNFAKQQEHTSSHDAAPSIAMGHYKPVQIQQPLGNYKQGSDSKTIKTTHLQSQVSEWAGNYNHQSSASNEALIHPSKTDSSPSYNNAPEAVSGHYSSAQHLQHSPSHDTAPSVATGNYKTIEIQQPSSDYNQGSESKPGKPAHLQSQNPEWSGNYHHNLPKTPALSHPPPSYNNAPEAASGHYSFTQKQQQSPSHDSAPSVASGHYKPIQIEQPSGNYNLGSDSKPDKSEHLQSQDPESLGNNQNSALKEALIYPSKPNPSPSHNNAHGVPSRHYNSLQKQQHSPSHDTATSIATGHYKPIQIQQHSGDYNQGSESKPGKSVHLQSQNLEWSGNYHQNVPKPPALSHPSKPDSPPSYNKAPEAAFGHYNSAQTQQHSPSHYSAPSVDSGHYKPAQIQQPSGDYYQGSDIKPDKSAHLKSHESECSENYKQNSASNTAILPKPNPSRSYNNAPETAYGHYSSAQGPPKLHEATKSIASEQYNSERNSQLPGNYNHNSASFHPHIQYYKPSQSSGNYNPQPFGNNNQGSAPSEQKLHSSVLNKQSLASSQPHSSQGYNDAISLSPKQFKPPQGTQHSENYDQSAGPYPTVSLSLPSFKPYNSPKHMQSAPISSDYNPSSSLSQSKSPGLQTHSPSPYDDEMKFNRGHWNSAQDRQTFDYYKQNSAPPAIKSHSSPTTYAVQSKGLENFNQAQEPKNSHVSVDNHPGKSAKETDTKDHHSVPPAPTAPVYGKHLPTSVDFADEKHNQNSEKLPTYPSSPSAKSVSENLSHYYVKWQTATAANTKAQPHSHQVSYKETKQGYHSPHSNLVSSEQSSVSLLGKKESKVNQQQSNIPKSESNAAPSDCEKSTPQKVTSENEKLHISPVIEKQYLPSHSQISNKISITSDNSKNANDSHDNKAITGSKNPNAEGQTIYNGVVYQGPYHYQPKYKHINFGNYNFWPFPVLAAEELGSKNNGQTNSSEQLLKQLQFIASKYNETSY